MPIVSVEQLEGSNLNSCSIVCFDEDGDEIPESDGTLLSDTIVSGLARKEVHVDEIFVISHGWQGDADGAMRQYAEWIKAMQVCRMNQDSFGLSKTFRVGVIGIHWPSKPIGSELFPATNLNPFEALEGDVPVDIPTLSDELLAEKCAASLSNTEAAKESLLSILRLTKNSDAVSHLESIALDDLLRSTVAKLILEVDRSLRVASKQVRAGTQDMLLKSSTLIKSARVISRSGNASRGLTANIVNLLSFYQMKSRAETIGGKGGAALLTRLLEVASPSTNIHLMGHSFGCIVVSSMAMRADTSKNKIGSLSLIQGALSIWSYSDKMPSMDAPGKYYDIISKVKGPIVTTQSSKDTAVGSAYPAAVSALDDERYSLKAQYPDYGALGAFGARGYGLTICDTVALPTTSRYKFKEGVFYNLNSDVVICNGKWPSGAHCDIAKPEIANAVWQAALWARKSNSGAEDRN